MKRIAIDINCDMGESYGRYPLGNDAAVMPFISSCNIACGFHGGDPLVIQRTIKGARSHGLAIGAHPSYPDLQGFGRRSMKIAREELAALISYQVSAIKGMVEQTGGRLHHVKPHGALYNDIARDESLSQMVIEVVGSIDEDIYLVGLAGSVTASIAESKQTRFIGEFFADRNYENNGQLVSRNKENAVLHEPSAIAARVLHFCETGEVISVEGKKLQLSADTICLHGDHQNAVASARAIHETLSQVQIAIEKVSS